jgi:hypothetical protein
MTKIWNFLLPETGGHELRVESIGNNAQNVYIDGTLLEAPPGTTMFTGPSGSLLELRFHNHNWDLFVNGLQVEEYSAGKRRSQDDTLRDLRSRPDGSYTIATAFTSEHLVGTMNKVRKFRFLAMGQVHEIEIAHMDWVWQILHNGRIIDRRTHAVSEDSCQCEFKIEAGSMPTLNAQVCMSWDNLKTLWYYTLLVDNLNVPPCWSKIKGDLDSPLLEVVSLAPAYSTDLQPTRDSVAPLPMDSPVVPPADLPQGVSFDSANGSYQANIRVNNKFLFLGEFATVDEAEQRYLQEKAKIANAKR